MALIDEQLVEEWLNRQNFFTIRGIKTGNDEIDLLAVRHNANGNLDYWHTEVQVSFRPVGYIGGNSNASKRTAQHLRDGVSQWVERKFTSQRKIVRRNAIVTNVNWHYILVHAELRDTTELKLIESMNVRLVSYKEVLSDLCNDNVKTSSSIAASIVEILNYTK